MATALDFTGMSGLEVLRTMFALPEPPPNIGSFLGMRLERLDEGDVAFSLPTRPDYANPLGTLHGGICATLLDSVMACAVHSKLPAGVGYGTLELKVNYVRAVRADGGVITATGTTIHVGRQTATAQGRVVDANGRLVAHGTTTCMVYR